jgi:hypothetical protein
MENNYNKEYKSLWLVRKISKDKKKEIQKKRKILLDKMRKIKYYELLNYFP